MLEYWSECWLTLLAMTEQLHSSRVFCFAGPIKWEREAATLARQLRVHRFVTTLGSRSKDSELYRETVTQTSCTLGVTALNIDV